MTAADDLFPGFVERRVDTGEAVIYVRTGGTGPGLLLLHGYPQSHAMWHRVAPQLACTHTVVAADLRGYGRSSCPPSAQDHRPYSKRSMARDMISLMRHFGFASFAIMGHDRGARVAYRMALDLPQLVNRLVLLDIISTQDQWSAANQQMRLWMFHWAFLAQPAPMPETLIGRDPADWLEGRFKRGTKSRSLASIDPRALADYAAYFADADRIHATCEDFRAGAHCDLADDAADWAAGRRIECPVLLLWGTEGPLADLADPLALWQPLCRQVSGTSIDCGHFIAEERPDALLEHAEPFLTAAVPPRWTGARP